MNTIAADVYWVIVTIWIAIVATVGAFYFLNRRAFGTTRLLLAVLALDGLRNVVENVYFGLYFGSKFGLFPSAIGHILGNPRLLILPKLGNVAAGCIVISLLLLKWLPEAIRERTDSEHQAKILHELATTDGMTGLYNRREFMALAEAEWQRFLRYRRSLSLLILDIDHFKAVNDRFGHDTGDQVIVGIATLCSHFKRTSDVAGRLGGEEFAILLPETSSADAHIFAERLRDLIAHKTLAEISATVSIGLCEAQAAGSIADLFKQADAALYEAKRGGRNQVCRFAQQAVG